jgi:murein DD-endopeptidase MepM/ murein hydrolase activator NlpD
MTPLSALLAPVAALAVALASLSSGPAGSATSARSASATRASAGSASPTSAAGTWRFGSVPRGQWQWPLAPRPPMVRAFLPPATTYGAGHRGVDLAGRPGQQVLAVDAGTVAHVGVLGGRGTVTVLHASGLRSTYEPVDGSVSRGQVVAQGQVVGTLATAGSHCAPRACLHLGAVRGGSYVDPLVLLERRRVRLLPLR